jgi:hypothetical protein
MDDINFEPEKFVHVLQQILQPATGHPSKSSKPASQSGMDMKSIMEAMDEELSDTTVRATFVDQNHTHQHSQEGLGSGPGLGEGEDDTPLDLDFSVIKHLLSSVSQEHGMPGPASTLLTELYKGSHKK